MENLSGFVRISVDRMHSRQNRAPFSNLSGIVWTGPQTNLLKLSLTSNFLLINSLSLVRLMKSSTDIWPSSRPYKFY